MSFLLNRNGRPWDLFCARKGVLVGKGPHNTPFPDKKVTGRRFWIESESTSIIIQVPWPSTITLESKMFIFFNFLLAHLTNPSIL